MLIPWKCGQQWGVEVGRGVGACWGGRVEGSCRRGGFVLQAGNPEGKSSKETWGEESEAKVMGLTGSFSFLLPPGEVLRRTGMDCGHERQQTFPQQHRQLLAGCGSWGTPVAPLLGSPSSNEGLKRLRDTSHPDLPLHFSFPLQPLGSCPARRPQPAGAVPSLQQRQRD